MDIYPGDKVTRTVKVLWPDGPRWVNEGTVKGWAYDAWCDNADQRLCSRCGRDVSVESEDCYHDADWHPVWNDGTPEPRSLEESIELLSDLGLVTFARR